MDHAPLVNAPTLPHAGKAPTTEAELATAVDGGIRDMCIDSMPGQGLHVILPNEMYVAVIVHINPISMCYWISVLLSCGLGGGWVGRKKCELSSD